MSKVLLLPIWKLFLLFLSPIILAIVLTNIGIGEDSIQQRYNTHFTITFGTLFFLLVFAWQYGMGLIFFAKTRDKSIGFKVNGILPVALYLVLFLFSLYEFGIFLSKKAYYLNNPGKVMFKPTDMGIAGSIINLLLLHSL